ncbi:hypothetical protein MJ1_0776 [Nanobdella aerobiophila]|uniref:Uncharacterized protein n=1 Tax=Nanobdella aerobiophila TaxID=2586965 RepID=A0A915WT66_9ARCH|nr:hypothetical protein [Nanobdella aerobiophila]BBL45912.1 hypothetical protein MJ1_0776 [Nanobdella aerobiophila]
MTIKYNILKYSILLFSIGFISLSINSQNYYAVTLTNTQSIPTPAPFQQDIAICNGSTSLVQNPYFSIVGNASSTGSTSASVTLPTGANIYLCNGGDGNGALSSYSWTAQETTQNTYASLGYQSSNVCSDSSGSTDIVVGGVAINTNEYENFVGTTFNGVNSFSYTYNVTNTSNVVISVACGWYACTSVTLPSGCQKLFDTIGGDTYETTVMGVCYNQTAGSYTVSGSLNGGGYVSVGIYEFSTIPPRLNTSLSYVNNITLYNEINSNGSNVYFFSNPSNPTGSLLYSWYEGQENTNGVSCDIWWVNISNGIPANSNITIYMDIGNTSTNYYSQYYPYVGVSYNVLGTFNYDNGNYVFNYYEKWGNLSSLPVGWNNLDSVSVSFSQNYTSFVQTSSNNYWYGLYYPLSNSNLQNRPLLLLSYYYSYPNGNTNYFGITSQTPVVSNTNYYTYYVTQTSPGYYNSLLYVSSGTATDTIGYLVYVPGSITGSYFNLYWTAVASYPPNGVMPSINIFYASPILNSLNFNQSIVNSYPGQNATIEGTIYINNPYNIETSISLSCISSSTVNCYIPNYCITNTNQCNFNINANSNNISNYSIEVLGKNQFSSVQNNFTLEILSAPISITNISISPNTETIVSGQSLTSNITIYLNNTYQGNTIIHLSCNSPSPNIYCNIYPNIITTNNNITYSELYINTSENTTMNNYTITVTASNSYSSINGYEYLTVYPYPIIYIISPNNNTISNYYGLNLTFYTNYPNVNITINGNTYNINVTPGTNTVYLRYNNSSNGLPSLYNIIPNGGNISIELNIESPTGLTNNTGIYNYQLPAPIFNVSYTSPTPSNGYISNLWLLQIYGNVYDNTEGIDYCNIQFLNQSNNQWVTISSSTECNDVFYNGLLQEYSKYNGQYYQLYYRIYGYNNYGLYNITPEQVIYFSPNSQNITVINNSLTNNQINNIIQGSINNNIPIVVFPQGIYLVNLNINPQGKNIELLGSGNVLFEPANPGLPVINIESSNVNITNINIQTNLFALRLTNGTVNIYNSNINSGLFGIQVENPSILNIYNSTINGNIGAIYGTGTFQNSTIENSNIQSSVWGIYDNNPENIIINNNNINANIFGIDLDGNAINNTINNNNVDSNIFGIKLNNGYNNYIENNNIDSNIFGIDLGSGNNYILNDLIKVGSVFGLYETNNNYINNVTAYGGIFGLNIYGNASNIYDYNSQLGVAINNNGTINNLTVSTGTIDINYIGSGFINNANSFASSIINNTIQYNFASGILLIGSLNANITFTNIPTGNYIIEKIVGGSGNIISTNNTFSPSGFGIYALYYS